MDANANSDSHMDRLLSELNAFPGILTFSSRGVHLSSSGGPQPPAGAFEVNFDVYPLLGGWRSLELIASAVAESTDREKLAITVWSMGGGGSACFELAGSENADPDLLAKSLSEFRSMFDDDLTNGDAKSRKIRPPDVSPN